jgi:hypothetical protein
MFKHFNPVAWFATGLGATVGVGAAATWLVPNAFAPVVHFLIP